jgi:RHS repeat-associated protein
VSAAEAYLTNAEYTAHGAPQRWQLGNGLYETSQYNAFLQLERKRIGGNPAFQGCGSATDDQLCLEWLYGAGNNNGNVVESRQWARKTAGGYLNLLSSFGYDGRNRLTTFSETVVSGGSTGGSWGQTNAYDRYGNRWATPTGITQSDWTPTQQSNFDAAKNQITTAKLGVSTAAVTHDVAGYMTVHPQVAGTLVYDAEGRLVSGGGASYSYDGEGRRIKRVAAGSTYWYWYGADGGLIAEDTPEQVEAGVQYLSVDALGSTRLVTKGNQEVAARIDYWPFGEEIVASSSAGNRDLVSGYGGAAALKQRFTGKERDSEMGFDYFGARYLASAQGRWTSPDAPFADQYTIDPQSWNLYSYTRNNPLRYVDRTGQAIETPWDAFNVGLDVASLVSNVASGNVLGAVVDTVGLTYDVVATVVPGLPGGAGAGLKALRAADNLVDAGQTLKKGSNILENAKLGKAFEQQAVNAVKKQETGVVEQLTVKTQSGVKTRLDTAGKDASGNVSLTDAKGSATAPFTKNQKKAYPEIQQSGATVVGKGRPGFPPGTQIPPTKVKVLRPDDLKKMNE